MHKRPDIKWKHEKGSEMMFDNLLETNDLDVDLSKDDEKFIKALIAGDRSIW